VKNANDKGRLPETNSKWYNKCGRKTMLRAAKKYFGFACLASDLATLVLSFFAAYALRAFFLPLIPYFQKRVFFPIEQYIPVAILSAFFLLLSLFLLGAFRFPLGVALHRSFIAFSKAAFLGFLLTIASVYLLKLIYVSRTFVALYFLTILGLGTLLRHLVSIRFRKSVREGIHHRNLILVGSGPQAHEFIDSVASNPEVGFSIRGFFLPGEEEVPEEKEELLKKGISFLGNVYEIPRFLEREVIDAVVIAEEPRNVKSLEELFLVCEELGVELIMSLRIFPHINTPIYFERLSDLPLLHFATTPKAGLALFTKRLIDIAGSLFGLILLSPFLLLTALLIKVTSAGPVFFIQERMGLRGRRFRLFKFRTMIKDAEKKLEELRHLNEADGPVFKMKRDPRLTSIGTLLRKSSIDELPQLWNVLRGEMSLVGPRPPISAEVEKYDRWQRRRLSMRPGLTCLWQISGRSELDFDTWMKLDLKYIENWSLTLDFIILLKTIPAVLSTRGAK
jgi:exopolysaccharide biosynthesis polyprenyl glycosylphosphotransferase